MRTPFPPRHTLPPRTLSQAIAQGRDCTRIIMESGLTGEALNALVINSATAAAAFRVCACVRMRARARVCVCARVCLQVVTISVT